MSNKNPTIIEPTFAFDENGNYHINPDVIRNHDNATWNAQRGAVPITSMDSDYLQKAFEDVQYAELKLLKQLDELNITKEHLLYEARRRRIVLRWLDEIKGKAFGGVFKAERAMRKIINFCTEKEDFKKKNHKAFMEEYRSRQQQTQTS